MVGANWGQKKPALPNNMLPAPCEMLNSLSVPLTVQICLHHVFLEMMVVCFSLSCG